MNQTELEEQEPDYNICELCGHVGEDVVYCGPYYVPGAKQGHYCRDGLTCVERLKSKVLMSLGKIA